VHKQTKLSAWLSGCSELFNVGSGGWLSVCRVAPERVRVDY